MARLPRTGATDATPLDPAIEIPGRVGDLLLVAGDGRLSTYELADRALVIGRGAECDVAIDHRTLSRRHAVLQPGARITVQDLGSTNGTRIAGQLQHGGEPIALAPGEGFHIGPFAFVLVARAVRDERSVSARDLLRVVDPTINGVPPLIADIAKSPANVLILGETGVGKEVLTSTIHELSGCAGALTRINCAALSESLLESELFGHAKAGSRC